MQRKIGRPGIAALLLCLMMTALLPAAALAENSDSVIEYTIEGYTGEYDGQLHSIALNLKQGDLNVKYSQDGGKTWQDENPGFKDVGSYTVLVHILKGSELAAEDSATVTIIKGKPELYFTPGNIVFQPGEKSRQLKWVYTGDAQRLYFTSSDSRHFWVDPSGGLVSLNQEGGVSIWVTAEETRNCKSVTAMCIVETESTLPQIDIDTKLDIDYPNQASGLLQQKVETVMADKEAMVLYVDAKLIDKRNPNKEIHNVRKNFTVPYQEILKENLPNTGDLQLTVSDFATSFDYTVLHELSNGTIEEVPCIPRANGLNILDTTLSPFAIIAFPKENYNLYYNVTGGTGTPLNQSVPMFGANQDVRVSTVRPTRAGFRFMGWSLSSIGEVQYAPGDTLTLDRDIVLYAIWSADMPQTGDGSRLGLWLALALASLLALGGMQLRRRKRA